MHLIKKLSDKNQSSTFTSNTLPTASKRLRQTIQQKSILEKTTMTSSLHLSAASKESKNSMSNNSTSTNNREQRSSNHNNQNILSISTKITTKSKHQTVENRFAQCSRASMLVTSQQKSISISNDQPSTPFYLTLTQKSINDSHKTTSNTNYDICTPTNNNWSKVDQHMKMLADRKSMKHKIS